MVNIESRLKEVGLSDVEINNIINQIENEFKRKNKCYGLVFEEHIEDIGDINLLSLVKKTEILEDKENLQQMNLLIEGENLHALTMIQSDYYGSIDIIYIDPPYNTGNKDFIYSDSYVDKTDMYRHSKWLSFMKKRLLLARELLSDDGVIFISIDDNEQASLKLLCDEIFGEENFISCLIRKTKSMSNNVSNGFNLQHEYALVYAKCKMNIKFVGREKDDIEYKNPDNDENGAWKSGDPSVKYVNVTNRERKDFGIENPYTHKIDYPPKGREWCFKYETYLEYVNNGKIKFKEKYKSNERGFVYKSYIKDRKSSYQNLSSLFGTSNEFMNQVGTKECNNLNIDFSYPKPVSYIKNILSYLKKDATILDFFAGSGTTGQAVLELNKEDGGNRKFILCTNNQNNICEEITYNRLKTVITGIRPDGTVYSEGLPANLIYYKIEKKETV